MNRKITHTVGGLALSIGLGAGCGGALPTPSVASDPKAVSAEIAKDLDRLRALHVVEVGQLMLDLPAAATSCYGAPCPGSEWQAAYDAERARQAARLDKLATLADEATHNQYLPPHAASEAQSAVAALAALAVVQVGGLVETQPVNSGSCYGICPADQKAADDANAHVVTVAFGIADAAKRSGL